MSLHLKGRIVRLTEKINHRWRNFLNLISLYFTNFISVDNFLSLYIAAEQECVCMYLGSWGLMVLQSVVLHIPELAPSLATALCFSGSLSCIHELVSSPYKFGGSQCLTVNRGCLPMPSHCFLYSCWPGLWATLIILHLMSSFSFVCVEDHCCFQTQEWRAIWAP